MNAYSRTIQWLVWGFLGAVILAIVAAYCWQRAHSESKPLPVISQVTDFALTNQSGQRITLQELRGHVWVANIIFTRCPGPCARMTQQTKGIQDALPRNSSARLVTLTADPTWDTPPVLKSYADRAGADTGRWTFLTGSKKEIVGLAVEGLKLTAIEKKPEERESIDDLFIHSTIFVIVDKRGRLRGIFETAGEEIDPAKVRQEILSAVRRLERER